MPNDTLPWAVQKWLNRSRCCLRCGLGWAKRSMCYMGAHWRNLANTIESFLCGGDAPYVKNYFDHLLFLLLLLRKCSDCSDTVAEYVRGTLCSGPDRAVASVCVCVCESVCFRKTTVERHGLRSGYLACCIIFTLSTSNSKFKHITLHPRSTF